MQNGIVTDIILVDIIKFSTLSSQQQLELITFLTKSFQKVISKIFSNSKIHLPSLILSYIPTGDGFYCILDPKIRGYGTFLALGFNHLSEHIAKKFPYFQGLKIAVHTGTIYTFTDILGHKNFIGEGLNDCERYIAFQHFSVSTVMVSQEAYKALKKFLRYHKEFDTILAQHEFKHSQLYTFKDKHEKTREGYLVWMRKSGIITLPKIDFL